VPQSLWTNIGQVDPKIQSQIRQIYSPSGCALGSVVGDIAAVLFEYQRLAGKEAAEDKKVMRHDKEEELYSRVGSTQGLDISALAFLVMVQTTKAAQEDLKAVVGSMEKLKVAAPENCAGPPPP
jgi:hypothetical protein